MRNPRKSLPKQSTHRRDANPVKRTTDWKALATVALLFVMGALFGAFVVAPLRWANDPDFIAIQYFAACSCAVIALFPGTLVFVGSRSLIGWFYKR